MGGLSTKARSAVFWNTGFNIFRSGLQFANMLVLVRLILPEAYGQFGLVTSIIGFISIFGFNNFLAHLLQVREAKPANFQNHFTAGAVLNLSMFVVTNVVAFCSQWSPKWSPVASLIHVMSLTFLLEWPCNFRIKMIERDFDWKRLRLLHAIGLVLSFILAVAMALAGAGVYALLVPGMIVTLPFIFDLFVTMRWRPDWEWSWQEYRTTWHFGVTRIGSGLTLSGGQLLESGGLSAGLGFAGLGAPKTPNRP